MKYTAIADAKQADGLRLSLTAGMPAPWSEAAKAIFRIKKIPFMAVAQVAAEPNEELVAWTGHRNAPTAMYMDEAPRVTWLDILNLAERLQPQPSLVPPALDDRILAYGLTNELAGERGLAWNARTLMLRSMIDTLGEEVAQDNPMFKDYHYQEEAAAEAAAPIIEILKKLEHQLQSQLAAGKRYLVGDNVSVVDIYFSCFSQMLDPLPSEKNPMPDSLREIWAGIGNGINAAGYSLSPELLILRDHIFEEYIGLPLSF